MWWIFNKRGLGLNSSTLRYPGLGIYCPYKSNREWLKLKRAGGADWERAVEIDDALRKEGTFYNRNMNSEFYIHRSCKPLKECKFDEDQMDLFDMECEGGCGL